LKWSCGKIGDAGAGERSDVPSADRIAHSTAGHPVEPYDRTIRIANGAAKTSCRSMDAATTNAAIVRIALQVAAILDVRSGAVYRPAGDTCHREEKMGDAIMAFALCDEAILLANRVPRR
jgi:hypothetical protein